MSKINKDSRARGLKAIMGKLASVVRSQSHRDKRVTFTATITNGRQVTIGQKGGTYVSQALTAIKSEGSIEDWVKVAMSAMYQGTNDSPGSNLIFGFHMNVTGYQTADKLAIVSRKKRIG